jgi:hypothetical protein
MHWHSKAEVKKIFNRNVGKIFLCRQEWGPKVVCWWWWWQC